MVPLSCYVRVNMRREKSNIGLYVYIYILSVHAQWQPEIKGRHCCALACTRVLTQSKGLPFSHHHILPYYNSWISIDDVDSVKLPFIGRTIYVYIDKWRDDHQPRFDMEAVTVHLRYAQMRYWFIDSCLINLKINLTFSIRQK